MQRLIFAVLLILTLIGVHAPTSAQETGTPFVSCDGRVKFTYSPEWTLMEEAQEFSIQTPEESYTETTSTITLISPEGAIIQILSMPAPDIDQNFIDLPGWVGNVPDYDYFGDEEELIINKHMAAKVYFTHSHADEFLAGFEIVFLLSNSILQLTATTTDDTQLSDLDSAAADLLNSIEQPTTEEGWTPLDWTTYFEDECVFKFQHPYQWAVQHALGRVLVFDSLETMDTRMRRRPLEEGQLAIEIFTPETLSRYLGDKVDFAETDAQAILDTYAGLQQISLVNETTTSELNEVTVLANEDEGQILMVIEYGDGEYGLIYVYSPNLADYRDDVMQLIESVRYNPPVND